jgi:hypothetical protein
MGFGFRIAPGVKVYPSSRGLGVGLGKGPLGYYIPAGGSGRSSVSAYQRQLRAAERAQQIEAVAAADNELVRIATHFGRCLRLGPFAGPFLGGPTLAATEKRHSFDFLFLDALTDAASIDRFGGGGLGWLGWRKLLLVTAGRSHRSGTSASECRRVRRSS